MVLIARESLGADTNQSRDVTLAPGQTTEVNVLDDPNVIASGDRTAFRRDTFYTWVARGTVARAKMNLPM